MRYLLLALALLGGSAGAQDYPNKPARRRLSSAGCTPTW